jgi:hypothetical protein
MAQEASQIATNTIANAIKTFLYKEARNQKVGNMKFDPFSAAPLISEEAHMCVRM